MESRPQKMDAPETSNLFLDLDSLECVSRTLAMEFVLPTLSIATPVVFISVQGKEQFKFKFKNFGDKLTVINQTAGTSLLRTIVAGIWVVSSERKVYRLLWGLLSDPWDE